MSRQILLLLYLLSALSASAGAGGDINLQLLSFGNPEQRLSSGELCDPTPYGGLESNCDLRMELCLGRLPRRCDLLFQKLPVISDAGDQLDSRQLPVNVNVPLRSIPRFFYFQLDVRDADGKQAASGHIATFQRSFAPKVGETNDYFLVAETAGHSVELEIRLQVTCQRFFYGRRCDKFCRARNSRQRCSREGQIECQRGWYGRSCSLASCEGGNACLNAGVCTQGPRGRSCRCPKDFGGRRCEIRNPCLAGPCMNGGACAWQDRNGLDFACHCPPNFNGTSCGAYMPCLSSPCLNSGTCRPPPRGSPAEARGWVCDCPEGFRQPRCEKDPCAPNPCRNGGRCRNDGARDFHCRCRRLYFGKTCVRKAAWNSCLRLPCRNGGRCAQNGPGAKEAFSCRCRNGFIGSHCEFVAPTHLTTLPYTPTMAREGLNLAVVIVLVVSVALFFILAVSIVVVFKRRADNRTSGKDSGRLLQDSSEARSCVSNKSSNKSNSGTLGMISDIGTIRVPSQIQLSDTSSNGGGSVLI